MVKLKKNRLCANIFFFCRHFGLQISMKTIVSRYKPIFEGSFFESYSFYCIKKNNEVHQNCSNFSNTTRINILSVPPCPPGLSTHFWCETSKSRFFFFF